MFQLSTLPQFLRRKRERRPRRNLPIPEGSILNAPKIVKDLLRIRAEILRDPNAFRDEVPRRR